MSDPRMTGLALMAISTSAFVGTTSGSLPPATFFPALLLFLIGAYKFLRTNHEALSESERRPQRSTAADGRRDRLPKARAPEMPESVDGDVPEAALADHANTIASDATITRPPGGGNASSNPGAAQSPAPTPTAPSRSAGNESSQVVAEQLRKLSQLRDQGILTDEEYAVAKAKLVR